MRNAQFGIGVQENGISAYRRGVYTSRKKAQRRLTSQAAPCYNIGMKG